jgi:hypothetical protein
MLQRLVSIANAQAFPSSFQVARRSVAACVSLQLYVQCFCSAFNAFAVRA